MSGDKEYLTILDELGPNCAAIIKEMRDLHLRKSNDYGSDTDALANIRASDDVGIPPALSAWLRGKDKVFRIDRHFKAKRLVNESVQDSLLDLASYCIITLKLMREQELMATT